MKPIGSTHRPPPEEVTRSLLRVTVSKDGSGRDFACDRPSRRRALKKARASSATVFFVKRVAIVFYL
jgi:hypothetical protein